METEKALYEPIWRNEWKTRSAEAYKTPKMGRKGGCKTGSKIVQVKGVMPLLGGLTRETPTGRAVGGFVVWHNFFEDLEEVMPVFIVFKD